MAHSRGHQDQRGGNVRLRFLLVAAGVAIAIALAVETLWVGYSADPAIRVLQLLAILAMGVILLLGMVSIALVQLGGWKDPVSDRDFDKLVTRSEALADRRAGVRRDGVYETVDPRAYDWDADNSGLDTDLSSDEQAEFNAALTDAVRALPLPLHAVLEHVAVIINDGGADVPTNDGERGAYGLYIGDTAARDYFHDRVLIFRDTLMRDFGDDPLRLRAEISKTLRHELAHHLGYDEHGVRDLGL